jgi:hypothetical protein
MKLMSVRINGSNDSVAPPAMPCTNLAEKWDSKEVPDFAAQKDDATSKSDESRKTGRLNG